MNLLIKFVSDYNIEIIIGLSVIILILLLLNMISQIRISKLTKKYKKFMEGANGTNIEDVLIKYIDEVKLINEELIGLQKHCKELENRLKFSVQKVGIVRYNAFNDMGSDLSFSIALLDDNLNGVVISGIFGRNESNTYAKPIINGKSNYPLSVEELQAIDRAKKQEIYNRNNAVVS